MEPEAKVKMETGDHRGPTAVEHHYLDLNSHARMHLAKHWLFTQVTQFTYNQTGR
jgi:hypothetical protein